MKTVPVSIMIPLRQVSENSCEIWMQVRSEEGSLDGLLEFPGGKIESAEDASVAALRELKEETGLKLSKAVALKNYFYEYPDRRVTLFVHWALVENRGALAESSWFKLDYSQPLEGIEERILAANKTIITDLVKYLKEVVEDGSWSLMWPQS